MLVPTRLMVRQDKAGWTAEIHPSFEHALLRWMRIPVTKRYGGLLSDALLPEPRPPSRWEYMHIGLLCITQDLRKRVHHRVRTKLSGKNIDPAEEQPHIESIIVFDEEVDERHTLDAAEIARWERGIARLTETSSDAGDLRWARGRTPPPMDRAEVAHEHVEDAEWSEVAESRPALPAPEGILDLDALSVAISMIGPLVPGPWAQSVLDVVPVSFAHDAAAASWARAAAAALRGLALSGLPEVDAEQGQAAPEPVDESPPVPEPAPRAEPEASRDGETSVDEPEPDMEPEPIPEPETVAKPVRKTSPMRRAPLPGEPANLTGLEQRIWEVLSTFQPMRKVDVALAIDHGRGAVNRAMDSIVAKGGAKDVGQSHYVRVVA